MLLSLSSPPLQQLPLCTDHLSCILPATLPMPVIAPCAVCWTQHLLPLSSAFSALLPPTATVPMLVVAADAACTSVPPSLCTAASYQLPTLAICSIPCTSVSAFTCASLDPAAISVHSSLQLCTATSPMPTIASCSASLPKPFLPLSCASSALLSPTATACTSKDEMEAKDLYYSWVIIYWQCAKSW